EVKVASEPDALLTVLRNPAYRQGHGVARSAAGWQNPSKHKRLGRCEGPAAQRGARGPGDRREASIGAQGASPTTATCRSSHMTLTGRARPRSKQNAFRHRWPMEETRSPREATDAAPDETRSPVSTPRTRLL